MVACSNQARGAILLRHCERSEAIQSGSPRRLRFLAMTAALALKCCHQRRVAARRGRVDAGHALDREARDIMRTARLWPCPAQPFAAERLAFDHCANLVAIDVEIADPRMLLDIIADAIDAAL